MPAPDVTVTNTETQTPSGPSTATGTAFFAGLTDQGPATPVACASVAEYVTTFGARSSTSSVLYDALNAFFEEGGTFAYVLRVSDSTATTASLTLQDSGPHPTVTVTALTPGIDGNHVYIEVTNTGGTEVTVEVQDSTGDVLETHGPYTTQAALLADATSQYVAFTQATGTGNTTNLPASLAATALTGGADASDITAASYVSALASFAKTLGPGQLVVPGQTNSTVIAAMIAHGAANNRVPCIDLADNSNATNVVSELGNVGQVNPAIAVAGSPIIPGLTPGTTRTTSAGAIVAALCARVAAGGNDNRAPAGVNWPLNYVTGFTETYVEADVATLNAAGINVWADRYGTLCLFGFVSTVLATTDPIFWQASCVRERMALTADVLNAAEPLLFAPIDGQGLTIANLAGKLQAVLTAHFQAGALYGANAAAAGSVSTSGNSTTTAAAGQLLATVYARLVPFAQQVQITDVYQPLAT